MQEFSVVVSEMGSQALIRSTEAVLQTRIPEDAGNRGQTRHSVSLPRQEKPPPERPGFESSGRSGIIHRELVNEETDLIDVFHIRRDDFDKVPFIGKGFGEDPAADDLATTAT